MTTTAAPRWVDVTIALKRVAELRIMGSLPTHYSDAPDDWYVARLRAVLDRGPDMMRHPAIAVGLCSPELAARPPAERDPVLVDMLQGALPSPDSAPDYLCQGGTRC